MGYAVVAERYDLFKEVFVRHFHDVDWKTGVFQPNIITILVIAAAIRILWALLVPVVPLSDSNAYDTFALNLWQHGVYGWTPDSPTSYWPVGTSALYALVYQIFGHNYAFIVALNLLLSLAIIFFPTRLRIYFLVSRWRGGRHCLSQFGLVIFFSSLFWPVNSHTCCLRLLEFILFLKKTHFL